MDVNAVDFERDFKKYFNLARTEEIIISDGIKAIVKLVPIAEERHPITYSLIGAFKKSKAFDINSAREERLEKKYENTD